MDNLFNEMLEKRLVSVDFAKMPDILRAFGRMLMLGTQEYKAEPKYWQRYAGIYDHQVGRGVLSFPRWLYNSRKYEGGN